MDCILSRCLRLLVVLALFPIAAQAQSITGTATFRERISLPPGAMFEAVLQDVSRADAGAPIIGRVRLNGPFQPPIAFEIPYDAARIRPEARYGVSARIRVGDRLVFVTDRLVTVLTRGGGNTVELLMRATGGSRATDAAPAGQNASSPRTPTSPPRGAELLGPLPASFAGALPCADCEAIDWQLDLLPGGAFRLAQSHRGKPERTRRDTIGQWRVDAASRVLHLRDAGGEEIRFDVRDRDTLRKRDIAGRPIDSRLNYELKRRAADAPLEARLTLEGMYVYMADAAVITLCATGERLPVATEADNVALERGYGALRGEPGEAMLVTLDALIAQRPGMEGGMRTTLVPERFIGAWPRESCRVAGAATPLEETYWRLTRLREAPVEATPRQREPHLVFRRDGGRLMGSGGCNRLVGGYMQTLEQLDVSGIGLTRMACPDGMEQEARFTAALADVARWRVEGRHLDLFDIGGTRILRFEAVALR